MEDISINVTKNAQVPRVIKQIKINPKTSFEEILKAAGKKLGIEAKILYNEAGVMVGNSTDIKDGETLHVSQGEKFVSGQGAGDSIESATSSEKPRVLKLAVFGYGSVGKSALTVRYTQKVFIEDYMPSFEDKFKKNLIINNEEVEVDIMDTQDYDVSVVMYPNFFKERDAFIIVYAVNDKNSFEALYSLHDQFIVFKRNDNAPLALVGNKCDLEDDRAVKKEEGMKLAKAFNAEFFETSAKNDVGVTELFEQLARKLYDVKYGASKSAKGRKDPDEVKCKCTIF